jgi:1,2-dihydroxy-3-keto-5-methylthiopentene dioxygenase
MKACWLDDGMPLEGVRLRDEGVHHDHLEIGAHEAPLAALMHARGYIERDEIALSPATEGLDAICARFDREHLHDEDEVRFVLEGEGVFDIRSRDDRWMRVEVGAGDLIVVPAARHHRFSLTDRRAIRCVRLFQDRAGWVPRYR